MLKIDQVLSVTASKSVSTVATGGTVTLGYLVSNSASTGAADATNVVVTLTLPGGFTLHQERVRIHLDLFQHRDQHQAPGVVTAGGPQLPIRSQ